MSGLDARNREILRRRRAGAFPTDIARDMGISRNAVIGVCHRAGVVLHDRAAAIAKHGRALSGAAHPRPRAKLTPAQVGAIRAELAAPARRPWAQIADAFGVSVSNIGLIASGRSWPHVAAAGGDAGR